MTGDHHEKTHVMNFAIKDQELIGKHKLIWNKTKNIIENDFITKTINREKYLNIKLEFYNGEIHTKFYRNNEEPKIPPK